MRIIILTMALLAGGCSEVFEELTAYPQAVEQPQTGEQIEAAQPQERDAAGLIFDAALAVCGVLGGAGAVRAGAAIAGAKRSYNALREIIAGNERFKQDNPEAKESFKLAQSGQSTETKQIVRRVKEERT